MTSDLLAWDSYAAAADGFEWDLPADYNVARDCLRRGAETRDQTALIQEYEDGRVERYSFSELDTLSDRVAHGLRERGVEAADRVAVLLSQKPATVITNMACWKMGAISVHLSVQLGADELAYRIGHVDTTVLVFDSSVGTTLQQALDDDIRPDILVEAYGDEHEASAAFDGVVEREHESFMIADTTPETPATIIYTSGTTGRPKATVQDHGFFPGHLPQFNMYTELEGQTEGVGWTPVDWASVAGIGNVIYPNWQYGRPVVGYPMDVFDPHKAFTLLQKHGITNGFLTPTVLRMMREVSEEYRETEFDLHHIASGGESVPPTVVEWAESFFDPAVVNEIYGQTEISGIVSECHAWVESEPTALGLPVPGHEIAILDPKTGEQLPAGEYGEIAVRDSDDPSVFQEYWNDPEKTAEKRLGEWILTGDIASFDEDGYLWFRSRKDDVITTAGYSLAPSDIEAALTTHDAVVEAGVIGVEDEVRGELIKAFIQLSSGVEPSDSLREDIQRHVREQYANYGYPREVTFVEELPKTQTGIDRAALRVRHHRR